MFVNFVLFCLLARVISAWPTRPMTLWTVNRAGSMRPITTCHRAHFWPHSRGWTAIGRRWSASSYAWDRLHFSTCKKPNTYKCARFYCDGSVSSTEFRRKKRMLIHLINFLHTYFSIHDNDQHCHSPIAGQRSRGQSADGQSSRTASPLWCLRLLVHVSPFIAEPRGADAWQKRLASPTFRRLPAYLQLLRFPRNHRFICLCHTKRSVHTEFRAECQPRQRCSKIRWIFPGNVSGLHIVGQLPHYRHHATQQFANSLPGHQSNRWIWILHTSSGLSAAGHPATHCGHIFHRQSDEFG